MHQGPNIYYTGLENLRIPRTSVSEIRGIIEMRSLALDDSFYNIADNFKIK